MAVSLLKTFCFLNWTQFMFIILMKSNRLWVALIALAFYFNRFDIADFQGWWRFAPRAAGHAGHHSVWSNFQGIEMLFSVLSFWCILLFLHPFNLFVFSACIICIIWPCLHHQLFFVNQKANLPLRLCPYQVLVASPESGLIETVPNAISLHSLKEMLPPLDTLGTITFSYAMIDAYAFKYFWNQSWIFSWQDRFFVATSRSKALRLSSKHTDTWWKVWLPIPWFRIFCKSKIGMKRGQAWLRFSQNFVSVCLPY